MSRLPGSNRRAIAAVITTIAAVVFCAQASQTAAVTPSYVRQLLAAFPPDGDRQPEVSVFRGNVLLADGVRGDTCILRVPRTVTDGQAAQRRRSAGVRWTLSQTGGTDWIDKADAAEYRRVQFWCVPLANCPADDASLRRHFARARQGRNEEIVFLGRGENLAVYARMPTMRWVVLQQKLALSGGDDPVSSALQSLRGTRANSQLAGWCYQALADCGPEAMEAVRHLIDTGQPHRLGAVMAMGQCDRPEVTAWLMKLVKSEDVSLADAARHALLARPRKAAEGLYVGWLAQRAGRESIAAEMQAIAALKPYSAAGPLTAAVRNPHNLAEYFEANSLLREIQKRPLPQDIASALNTITAFGINDSITAEQADQALGAIIASKDSQTASMVALELALGDHSDKPNATQLGTAGMYLLANLADKGAMELIKGLIKTCRDSGDAARLKRLLQRLNVMLRSGLARPGGRTFVKGAKYEPPCPRRPRAVQGKPVRLPGTRVAVKQVQTGVNRRFIR
ncbi:MAG: hypothetical protein ACYS8X_07620 [Planctomycetota bacterium]